MSKELIEQLAKEHGLLVEIGGVTLHSAATPEKLQAFAKAYAQTRGQSDTERLQWMFDNDAMIYEHDGSYHVAHPNKPGVSKGAISATFRDAIDSAMSAAPIESGVKG